MDLSSPFKAKIFRPITILLIPGLIASLPYTLLVASYFPEVGDYRDQHEIVYYTIVALIVVGIGFVLEDVGTELELAFDRLLMKKEHPDLYEVWYQYLALTLSPEPVGQRYLRTVLLRMKFELSAAVALVVCYFGIVWLGLRRDLFSALTLLVFGLLFIGLALFLVHQGYKGTKVLANVRRALVGKPVVM